MVLYYFTYLCVFICIYIDCVCMCIFLLPTLFCVYVNSILSIYIFFRIERIKFLCSFIHSSYTSEIERSCYFAEEIIFGSLQKKYGKH